MRKTSVVVVDDHQVVCAGLRSMINAQPDLGVVAEATSGKEALERSKKRQRTPVAGLYCLTCRARRTALRLKPAHQGPTQQLSEAQFGLNVLRGGASGFIGKARGAGADAARVPAALRRPNSPAARRRRLWRPNAPLHGASEREFRFSASRPGRVRVADRRPALTQRQDRLYVASHPRQDVTKSNAEIKTTRSATT
jgi:DNA-binding NarL/FixJ family response regulator